MKKKRGDISLTPERDIDFIGAAFGWGAQERGTEFGPESFDEEDFFDSLLQKGLAARWHAQVTSLKNSRDDRVPVGSASLPLLEDFLPKLSAAVETSLNRGAFPVVIGGDHSIAVGTWAALKQTIARQEAMGLLWIDAHLDAHTPETTPSQAYHGMPLAALLGYGDPKLVNHLGQGAKIKPEHSVILGARSWETGEYQLLQELGVRLYKMDEIRQRGFSVCFEEALTCVEKQTEVFGLSFDLDAFDPTVAPGVGSPEPGGLEKEEVFEALAGLGKRPRLKALEVVEFNPYKDVEGKTKKLLQDLLTCLL